MPAQSLHHLGDEPIYCEAVHDSADDVYSGSDDDHYEGKLHRRLHIEKKAIEILNGQIPVLLSARLRGPFDSQHWNNPWISRRTERQAENPGTQSTLSHLSIQRAQDDGPGQLPEGNLPNTQGTSLYPLPSPEITNPPSARKNPYMEEDEYNRIKTWREAVKGTSISKDPFWLSQQDDSDSVPITRKRSADQQWLHRDRRRSKRQKPTDMKTSLPEESPSQAASKMRKRETRRPRPVSLSGQSSSAHEDELATGVNTRNATSGSRLANRNIGTPRSRRIERRSPRRKSRLQEAESSEDELSMPSTTPTHKAARSSAGKAKIPKGDGSPRRSTTAMTGTCRAHSSLEQADQGRTRVERIQPSQLSARQRSSIDGARLGMKTTGSAGENPGPEAAKTYETVQTESSQTGSAARKLKTCTKQLADMALSQQDSSFYFHKGAKSPAGTTASRPSPNDQMDGTDPSLSSGKLHVSTAAVVGPMDDEYCASQDEENDDDASVASDSANAMDLDPDSKEQIPCESVEGPEQIVGAQLAKQIQLADKGVEDGEPVRKYDSREIDGVEVTDATQAQGEPEAMVAVKTAGKFGSMREVDNSSEEMAMDEPQVKDQDKKCAPPDPEWSTYLNTQDLPSTSATMEIVPEGTHGIPVVQQGIDDSSDLEWSSYVDTQELSAVDLQAEVTQEESSNVPAVVYQGTDDQADPEWSTYLNTQDLSSAIEPQQEDAESNYEDALEPKNTTLANYTPTVEEDGDSDSEWSTYRSTSSQVDGDPTGCTSHEPVSPEALQDAKPSQASVGSIIDVYADKEQSSVTSGPGGDSIVTDEPDQGIIISIAGTNEAEETRAEEQGETAIHPVCTTSMEIQEAKEDSTEGSLTSPEGFDETTISVEPPKMADGGVLNETSSSIVPRQVHNQPHVRLQTPQTTDIGADTTTDPSLLLQTTTGLEPLLLQSPWAKEADFGSQVPALCIEPKPSPDSFVVDVTTKCTEALDIQSPWAKEPSIGPHKPAAQNANEHDILLDGSSSALNTLTGKALSFSQSPQSPWMAPTPDPSNLPTPDFTMSIKAFSDFATPSPTKKGVSFNGSILRDRIKTPLFQKPRRRVHFAPLPGEEAAGSIEVDQNGDDTIYVEEDVSYLTPGGRKTGTIRVSKPPTRAASPPPMDVSSAEVGGLPDYDSKFAKHFEAVAKRKKNLSRKALRLLPSDSQQTTTTSQDVGAMAEAFIQASQTRRKAVEMTAMDTAEATAAGDIHELPSEKSFSPISVRPVEEQENAEPVDDVSAVLDNLGEFLDNTWGVGLGAEVEGEETRVQPQPQTSQDRPNTLGVFDMVGDPMRALSFNVWAD